MSKKRSKTGRTGRKFKAVNWAGSGKTTWYVVEVNDMDGSYWPKAGPLLRATAEKIADALQEEWRLAGGK